MTYNDEEILFKEEEPKSIKAPFIKVFIPNLATPRYRELSLNAINDFFNNYNVVKNYYCITIKQPTDGATEGEILDFLTFLKFDLIKFYNENGELSKIFYKGRIGYPLNRLNEIIDTITTAPRVLFFIRDTSDKTNKEQPINVDLNNLIDTIDFYKRQENIKINFCIENIGYYNGAYFYMKDKYLSTQPTDKLNLYKERYKEVENIKRDKFEKENSKKKRRYKDN
jgi:hypothetical protein